MRNRFNRHIQFEVGAMTKFIGSYSALSCWRICKRQFLHRYILRDLPKVDSPELIHGRQVHETIASRLNGAHGPLPDEYEKLVEPFTLDLGCTKLVEEGLGVRDDGKWCDFWDENVYFRGKVDLALLNPTGTTLIVDWKTGKVREDATELILFSFLIWARYPHSAPYRGVYVWLKEMELGETHQLNPALGWGLMRGFMDNVERETEFAPSPGPLCGWCPVESCEYHK